MRLTKRLQCGLLFGIYLARSGRVSTPVAAQNLGLSYQFLEQVARDLRIAGILESVRGPGGGYELIGNPKVKEFFDVLSPVRLISKEDSLTSARGETEHRAFALFVGQLGKAVTFALEAQTIRDVASDLVDQEIRHMDTVSLDCARAN